MSVPAPSVFPVNDDEIQDRKAAELGKSDWEDIKRKNRFSEWKDRQAGIFLGLGEVFGLIRYSETFGKFLGYEPLVDEKGEPVYQSDKEGYILQDENGNYLTKEDKEKAVFEGGIEIVPYTSF